MAKNPHAVALGRKGGRAKSEAKAEAARKNGAKGGRPPKADTSPDEYRPRIGDEFIVTERGRRIMGGRIT